MKTILLTFIVLGCGLASINAVDKKLIPNGIHEKDWHSIHDGFGFVITGYSDTVVDKKTIDGNEIPVIGQTALGYFMIYRDNKWLRLKPTDTK